MLSKIGNQFKKPDGFLGKIISKLMIKGNGPVYDYLIEYMNIKPQEKLYEIGFGHGAGIAKILNKHDCSIAGIDFSGLMLKQATRSNKEYINNNKLTLELGDFLEANIPENNYDKIFCVNVVYFWENLETPFQKIISLLKPGGNFFFFMLHRDGLKKLKFTKDDIFNKYSIEFVVDKLKTAGFKDVEYQYTKGYFVKCCKNQGIS